jgi:hypothetical protein
LLALIEEADGIAAQALHALGVSGEAVREKVRETIGMAPPAHGSPPFTPRAKKVLELSLREALQRMHSYIGTEHLLLGVVREGEGVAATVLTSMGVDLSQVRQKVILLMSEQSGREMSTETGPLCPQCHGELGQVARVQPIFIQSGSEDSVRNPLLVDAVYCSQCGSRLHMFKADFDKRQSPRNIIRSGSAGSAGRVRFPDDVSPSEGATTDDDSIRVDLVHQDRQLSGLVGDAPVDFLLDVPRHVGEARGNFAGRDFVASWQLGDNYFEHPDLNGTAKGTFAGHEFDLQGVFHLDPNYAITAAEISGRIGGKEISARLQPALGGLSPTRTVAIDGTFAGTNFSIFATISGDLTRGHIRGQVGGHVIRLDADNDNRTKTTGIKGTFGGPPAILTITVAAFLYFI